MIFPIVLNYSFIDLLCIQRVFYARTNESKQEKKSGKLLCIYKYKYNQKIILFQRLSMSVFNGIYCNMISIWYSYYTSSFFVF